MAIVKSGPAEPKYFPVMCKIIEETTFRAGATMIEIANILGVSDRTLYRWMERHDELCQSVIHARARADDKVVESLFSRACGCTVIEERLGSDGTLVKTKRELPPDTEAAVFWLCNRDPEHWRRKVAEVNVAVPIQIVLEGCVGGRRRRDHAMERANEDTRNVLPMRSTE